MSSCSLNTSVEICLLFDFSFFNFFFSGCVFCDEDFRFGFIRAGVEGGIGVIEVGADSSIGGFRAARAAFRAATALIIYLDRERIRLDSLQSSEVAASHDVQAFFCVKVNTCILEL